MLPRREGIYWWSIVKLFFSSFENFWNLPHLALSGVPCAGMWSHWHSRPLLVVLGDCAFIANLHFFPPSNATSEAFKPIKHKLKWPSQLISTFELGAVGLDFKWCVNSVKMFHKNQGKVCSSLPPALGLLLIESLAESRWGGWAPQWWEWEGGFSQPGIVCGIPCLGGKKCSNLPHAYSLLAEVCICWPAGHWGGALFPSVTVCASTEPTALCSGQFVQPVASWHLSAGTACSVAGLHLRYLQKCNSSIVLALQQ